MSTAGPGERIAVIIPCFNDGALVRDAVRSVVEDEPIEIVVVDDFTTDEPSHAVLDELRADGVRVVRHEQNAGVANARATGVRATHAEFVFPLDADDLAVPGALAAMADCLEADPDAAACFGDYAEFGDSDIVRAVPERLDPFRLAYTNEYPISAMFRRRVLEDTGGWAGQGYTAAGTRTGTSGCRSRSGASGACTWVSAGSPTSAGCTATASSPPGSVAMGTSTASSGGCIRACSGSSPVTAATPTSARSACGSIP